VGAGRALPLVNTRLRGPEIEFTIDDGGRRTVFRGAVSGNKMGGAGNAGARWSATRP
jgi:hypothetical protein